MQQDDGAKSGGKFVADDILKFFFFFFFFFDFSNKNIIWHLSHMKWQVIFSLKLNKKINK